MERSYNFVRSTESLRVCDTTSSVRCAGSIHNVLPVTKDLIQSWTCYGTLARVNHRFSAWRHTLEKRGMRYLAIIALTVIAAGLMVAYAAYSSVVI